MGTRLWLEHVVKQKMPHVRYVRINNCGQHHAVIYAWDDQLQLSEKDALELHQVAAGYSSPDVCFTVKPYQEAASDRVCASDVPERLRLAAMNGSLNQDGVFSVLNSLFAGIMVTFRRYDVRTGVVHLAAYSHTSITDRDRADMKRYADELMPVGAVVQFTYYGL